jgi:hypothetical protein
MAGISIKFRFRLSHADIKAGRFLHCHHHRWLWLASQHAELVIRIGPCIGTNSAYKRERWYVTKLPVQNWPDYLESELFC